MNYICPVCGYDGLDYPPQDFSICPSCGTEFGNSDFEMSWDEIRANWIGEGFKWASQAVPPPPYWNPIRQLQNILPAKTSGANTVNRGGMHFLKQGKLLNLPDKIGSNFGVHRGRLTLIEATFTMLAPHFVNRSAVSK